MNFFRHRFAIGALTLLSTAIQPAVTHAEEQLLDQVVAVVNDDVVMRSELQQRANDVYNRLTASGTEVPSKEVLVPQVLERLILERLQLSRAERAGVRISDQEVSDALDNMAKRNNMSLSQLMAEARKTGLTSQAFRDQIRTEMLINRAQRGSVERRIQVTEQEIDNFLKTPEGQTWSSPDVRLGHIILPLSAGAPRADVDKTEARIRQIYEKLKGGADFKSTAVAQSGGPKALQGGDMGWRKLAQMPNIFMTAIEKLEPGNITIPIRSEAGYHILKLYERRGGTQQMVLQHHVRHILLKPNEIRTEEDTKAMLEGMRADILDGADFAALAKQHSEDIGSAMGGGSLGWSLPGQFVPKFEQTVNTIELNKVSEPIRTQFGWHIVQVTERRNQDFKEDIQRRQAANILKQRKYDEELQVWLQQIRDEAFVDIK